MANGTTQARHTDATLADDMIGQLYDGAKKLEPQIFEESPAQDKNVPIDNGLLPDVTEVGLILLRNIDLPNEAISVNDPDTGQYSGTWLQFIDGNLVLHDDEEGRWQRDYVLNATRGEMVYEEPKSGPEFTWEKTGFTTRNQAAYERYIQIWALNQ